MNPKILHHLHLTSHRANIFLRKRIFVAATVAAALAIPAHAQLASLSTGVAADGSTRLPYNSLEQNYSVYYSSSLVNNPGLNATPYLALVSQYVGQLSVPNPANASWIAPITTSDYQAGNFDRNRSNPVGFFYFTATAGFSGQFQGAFASDNTSELLINGNVVATDPYDTSYEQWMNLDVNINKGDSIEWIVYNSPDTFGPNPAGLVVAAGDPVPPSQIVPQGSPQPGFPFFGTVPEPQFTGLSAGILAIFLVGLGIGSNPIKPRNKY
jgi:hypothetical protein